MTQLKTQSASSLQRHEYDSGSTEVQIALLTGRIKHLTSHFKTHAKDFGSKRGLLVLIGRRRRLLEYLKRRDFDKYKEVLQQLELRK